MKFSAQILSGLFLILLSASRMTAQTNRGAISGTVSDSAGGVIPGAVVIVTNAGTNQSQKLTTSADGAYAVLSLEPVVYRITVEAPGFKQAVVAQIKVDTASTATVNVTLQAGGVETVIDITAATPILNTASGVTSQTITERQIQDIPLNNRSVLDLAVTLPNVSGDSGSEDPEVTSGQPVPGFNLSLNGGRPGSTAILADGVNNTGVGIARAVVSFSPETVQEFTVQTSAYDAQYGRTGGGVINATTKSGTNSFTGIALFYHRNPATNAQKWTTSTLRPPNYLRYNQGSFTLGGPIWLPKKVFGPASYDGRDKSFFFFAYEPRWRRDFLVVDTLLPTDAMRGGDFNGLSRIANGWVPTDVLSRFPRIPVTSTNTTIYQQFNPVGGRFVPITLATGSTNNFNAEERYNVNDIVYWNRGAMSWKFGFDVSHERLNVTPFFGASGGRWDFRVLNTSNNRTTNAVAGGNVWASYLLGVPNQILARPVLIPYYYRWNSGAAFVQNDWKVKSNLTLNLGLRYSLQLLRAEKYNRQGVFAPDLSQTVTLTDAQRRATAIGLGLIAANSPANTPIPSIVPTTAKIPAFAYSGRGGRSKYITPIEYTNFEPRFGFAWSPEIFGLEKGRFVVRGGYGISHAPNNGNNRAPSPDFGATNTISTGATGSTGAVDPTQPVRLSANPPIYPGLTFEQALNIPADGLVSLQSLGIPGFAISGNTKIPYVQNWNLSLSYEVMRNTVVEVAYVGNKGTRLFMPRINTNNGATIAISRGSVGSEFLEFNNLYSFFDASANSIRHATYVRSGKPAGALDHGRRGALHADPKLRHQ